MSDPFNDTQALIAPSGYPNGLSRREFIQTAIGLGFATAVLPVSAETISTDSDGLLTQTVSLQINGATVPMYVAQPKIGKHLPVIVVLSEIFGVHEHIADVTRRFAKLGYMAIAPELFIRQGDARSYTNNADLMKNLISKVPDAQVMTDIDAAIHWAQHNGGHAHQVGVTGFCWGGRITYLYCAHNPKVTAAVAWYGRVIGEPSTNFPKHPIDVTEQIKTPILGLYGAKDTGISVESVEKIKAALAIHHKNHSEFVIYPEAGHAFHADYRPSYNEAAAKDGWIRCLHWFNQHGLKPHHAQQ